jgi:glutamate-ammonia-ligase adenylyltransferase
VRYYTRFTQRLIAALSAPTAEGVLYEVDMRLRPSGNKGPVATRLRAFERYQREEAWTWEHMALTRARLMCGDEGLIQQAEACIARILSTNNDQQKIAADVAEMRSLIDAEKPPLNVFDIKLIAGGLIDLEFLAQYLALIAPQHGITVPSGMTTAERLKSLGAALINPDDLETCLTALRLYNEVSHVIRTCIDGGFQPSEAPAGLIDLMVRVADCPDLKALEAELKRQSKAIRRIFQAVVRA